jgi:hypothetical protein
MLTHFPNMLHAMEITPDEILIGSLFLGCQHDTGARPSSATAVLTFVCFGQALPHDQREA